jgi:hypothetical protein
VTVLPLGEHPQAVKVSPQPALLLLLLLLLSLEQPATDPWATVPERATDARIAASSRCMPRN